MLAKARVRIQGIRKHQPMVIQIERRQDEPLTGDQIRRKIEALGGRLSLPTVKRALGMLEGEHRSIRRGTGYEFLDLRPYSSGDEARSIDWKASARAGRPMIADKEQNVTSRVWMLLDTGAEMLGTCDSGETQLEVALNSLRMFATLSLRRGDELSVVLGDSAQITRIPLTGGYLAFDALTDQIANRQLTKSRDLVSLLDYAKRIHDRHSLLIIATASTAWTQKTIDSLAILSQTHPLIVSTVETLNPFSTSARFRHVIDATSSRRIPAFMRTAQMESEVQERREFTAKLLEQRLAKAGAALLHGGSSQTMFDQFITHIASALTRAGNTNVLAASALPSLPSTPAPPKAKEERRHRQTRPRNQGRKEPSSL